MMKNDENHEKSRKSEKTIKKRGSKTSKNEVIKKHTH